MKVVVSTDYVEVWPGYMMASVVSGWDWERRKYNICSAVLSSLIGSGSGCRIIDDVFVSNTRWSPHYCYFKCFCFPIFFYLNMKLRFNLCHRKAANQPRLELPLPSFVLFYMIKRHCIQNHGYSKWRIKWYCSSNMHFQQRIRRSNYFKVTIPQVVVFRDDIYFLFLKDKRIRNRGTWQKLMLAVPQWYFEI